MQLKQYYLGCLSHASYLITDAKSKTAAVVDPQRDVAQYIDDAKAAGCQIKYVSVTRLGRIGFDNVEGYLVHGMQSLHNHPELIGKIERITAVALAD